MSEMQWQTLPLVELRPAAYNPRKALKPSDKEYQKIKNSIQEFGYVEPIIVNHDMTVIGGHQRLTVLKDLGYTEAQCVVLHIEDEAKAKALNIALNKISGEWNEQLLADLLVDLQDAQFNLDLTGFEAPEIDQLFSKLHNKDIEEDDFDVEEELKNPAFSQAGDIWTLGRHRVICGDSTLPETFKLLMEGKKANLVLTDPPYNVNVEETAGKIKNDNMPDADFYNFLFCAFVNMEQNMEQDASIYVFHADTQGLTFRRAFADAGFNLSGCCIWKKNALVLGRSPYQWQHEPCLFGWKKGGKHLWYSDRKQTTIWNYDKPKRNANHPTSKPLDLLGYPIGNSTQENAVVIDTFGGSGSTMMACEQMNRVCCMMELDEKYASVILRRAVKNGIPPEDIFVERNGEQIPYSDLAKEVESS